MVQCDAPCLTAAVGECEKQPRGLWQRQFDAEVKGVLTSGARPLLLLHACCAPCTAGVLWQLIDAFRVIVFYYNPNIAPREEYDRRLEELQRFIEIYPLAVQHSVALEVEDASYSEWEAAVGLRSLSSIEGEHSRHCEWAAYGGHNEATPAYLASEPERGKRCRRCYAMRLRKAKEAADRLGAQYFATTLTLSPHKDADAVNACGLAAGEWTGRGADGAKYLVSDFKKRDGFLKSLRLSAEYGLYRQQYCGCECSMRRK